jgi:hypothetical protein
MSDPKGEGVGVRRIGRSAFYLMDHTFRSLAGSAAFARVLDLVSREDPPASGTGDGRALARIPDLGYRAVIHAGDPIPVAAPGHLRAWHVQWKPRPRSAAEGLGYKCLGGFYLPRTDAGPPRPGILVLPVLHDRFSLASGTLARYLASQGFAALELRSGTSFLDGVRVTPSGSGPTWEEVVAEMIVDGRRGLDWLCSRPEVDGRRLGIMGVSHGAIIGPCVLGADPRLSAGVFCMGGADEAMIVARSRERSVRRFRRRLLRARGLTDPEELERLGTAQTSRTEPMRYAAAVDPRAVLLFKTRLDRAVVPEAQDKLWEALGRPRRITLPFGHIGFGLAFYYAARRAAAFLWERLSAPA